MARLLRPWQDLVRGKLHETGLDDAAGGWPGSI